MQPAGVLYFFHAFLSLVVTRSLWLTAASYSTSIPLHLSRPSSLAPGVAGATVAGAQSGATADGGSYGADRGRAGQRP